MSGNSNEVKQVVEVSLGLLDVISLFSGIFSLAMGGLAIWLSITFYKMSDKSSKEIQTSSNNIDNSVGKLEKMFDTMYSDTFGMVKDTVNHMREQVDRNTNGIDITKELDGRIKSAITERLQKVPSDNLTKKEVRELFIDLLDESKEIEIEVKKSAIEDKIKKILSENGEQTYGSLRRYIIGDDQSSESANKYFNAVLNMSKEGIVENHFYFENGMDTIEFTAPMRLLKR